MDWTKEAIDTLILHRAAGLTSGQIAKEMGITRNAIMGKLNRLGLVGDHIPKIAKPKKPRKPRAKQPDPVVMAEPEIVPEPIPEMIPEPELEPEVVIPMGVDNVWNAHPRTIFSIRNGECKWPLGGRMEKPSFFCGEPCGSKVYCEAHSKESFQPARPRQYPEKRI